MRAVISEGGEAPDFQALYEGIVDTPRASPKGAAPAAGALHAVPRAAPAEAAGAVPAENVISRIGQMTRTLHDTLRELGYDKALEKAAATIPDARDRLAYVSTLTEQAAERVLNATDAARPIQDEIEAGANELARDWKRLYDRELSLDEFRQLAGRTREYLGGVPERTRATNAYLMEIMMAQDFQDLTGQVIKKITDAARSLEQQLVQLLLDNVPPEKRADTSQGFLNGPVINAEGRSDVVTSQDQVDDLLESLGF